MAKTNWQRLIDERARSGLTIGQNWYDTSGLAGRVSAKEAAEYAISKGYGLGEAWKVYAQPKKEPQNLTQALRIAGEGGITRDELAQITKQFDTPANKVIQRLDAINQNLKAKDQAGINLNSGAANMIIKEMQNATPQSLGYMQPSFGTGNIGKTIQSMIGSPGFAGVPVKGQMAGATEAVPSQMMIGGTTIRPGGRVAVRPMGAAPAVGAAPVETAVATTPTATETPGDAFDFQSILDALTGTEEPQMDMSALTDMFNTQFEELSSQFDTMKPLQLAQLGRAYGGDAIRAAQRMRKTRRDYRRGLPAQALGQAVANLAIGGGLTI